MGNLFNILSKKEHQSSPYDLFYVEYPLTYEVNITSYKKHLWGITLTINNSKPDYTGPEQQIIIDTRKGEVAIGSFTQKKRDALFPIRAVTTAYLRQCGGFVTDNGGVYYVNFSLISAADREYLVLKDSVQYYDEPGDYFQDLRQACATLSKACRCRFQDALR